MAFVLTLLAMAYAVKILAAVVYRAAFRWRQVLAIGTLTSSRLSLIIVVSMTEDEDRGFAVAIAAKETYAVDTVVAYVASPQAAERFVSRNIQVVDPSLSSVLMLEGLIAHPHVFSLLADTAPDSHMVEVRLRNPGLVGHRLRQVPLPGDALIVLLARGGELLIPDGRTRLLRGDQLTLVGSHQDVEIAAEYLRG